MVEEILKSKTILGIAGLLALLSPRLFGFEITESEIMDYIEPIAVGIFGVLAFYGRLTAKGPIILPESTQEIPPMNDEDETYGGALDGIADTDFVMGTTVDASDLPISSGRFDIYKIQYNQNLGWSRNGCTVFAAMGAVSDLTGLRWTDAQMKDVYDTAVTLGLDPNVGWYTHKAVDLVRKKALEHLKVEVAFVTFYMGFEELRKSVTDKGYSIVTGYSGNSEYNKDKNEDGVISKIHKPTTYGHAIRRTNSERIVDNYFGSKFNVYENDMVDEMIKEGTHHNWGFVFFNPKTPLEQWKDKVKARIEAKKKDNDYLFIRKGTIFVPNWVSKTAQKKVKNGINFVMINGEWKEYRI